MKKLILFLTVLALLCSAAIAQQITGVVKDEQGKGIEKATVSLLMSKDSSVIKLAVTAVGGKYSFAAPGTGTYLISATHVGYSPVYSSSFEVSGPAEIAVPDMMIDKATGNLGTVTVTSKKPMVEVKADKIILNVEGTINAAVIQQVAGGVVPTGIEPVSKV